MAEATVAQQRAAALVDALWNDSTFGNEIQKRAKEMFPEAGIRTADETFEPAVAPIRKQLEATSAELKALREERDAEKKASEERAAEAQKKSFEDQINAARNSYNLTDEGFDKMVARMKETGNYTDPDAAAAWVASKNPPAPVNTPTFGPQALNFWGAEKRDESLAELHRDPQRYMDDQLAQFVRDPDRYVQETLGGR